MLVINSCDVAVACAGSVVVTAPVQCTAHALPYWLTGHLDAVLLQTVRCCVTNKCQR